MGVGQELRMTDVPFSSTPDPGALVYINDAGKLRQTDLTTVAKYSQLYELIIGAHNDAMSAIQTQLDNGQANVNTLLQQSLATLNDTKASLDEALNTLHTDLSTALQNQQSENLTNLETLYNNSITSISNLINEGQAKLQADIATVDDLRTAVATLQTNMQTVQQTLATIPAIRTGTAAPSDAVGVDGDIYIQIID